MKKFLSFYFFLIVIAYGCSNDDGEKIPTPIDFDDRVVIEGLTYNTKLRNDSAILVIKNGSSILSELSWPIKGGRHQSYQIFDETVTLEIEKIRIRDFKVAEDNLYILIEYINTGKDGVHELILIRNNQLINNAFIKKRVSETSGIPHQLKEWYKGSVLVLNNTAVNQYERASCFSLYDSELNLLSDDQIGKPDGEYAVGMYKELILGTGWDKENNKQVISVVCKDIRRYDYIWKCDVYSSDFPIKITDKEIHFEDNTAIVNIQYVLENGEKFNKNFEIDINTGKEIEKNTGNRFKHLYQKSLPRKVFL